MKTYPALNIGSSDADLIAALVDDYSPTAIEPRETDVRVFFTTPRDRDHAQRALTGQFDVAAIEVSDEDWARRSQDNLQPITVGRITVFPSAGSAQAHPQFAFRHPEYAITITPSMGFGTGHHATTRLCLEALQAIDVTGRDMLDVGTGSGVLAIAAALLGASRALGVDIDSDAIQSARENLELNASARGVEFAELDLAIATLPLADVVTANLTGALLERAAAPLIAAVRPGGTLILSGLQAHERDRVAGRFGSLTVVWEREADGWVGFAVKKS